MKKYFKSLLAVVIAAVVFVPAVKAEEITVTFDTNGGSEVASQTIEVASHITAPTNPTKEGVVFAGWYKLLGDEKFPVNLEYDYFYENTTLYADWVSEDHIIKTVNITMNKPKIGDDITPETETEITAEAGAHYNLMRGFFIKDYSSKTGGEVVEYSGKFKAGEAYYYEFQMDTNEGYYFDDNVVIKINGKTTEYEVVHGENNYINLQVKIVNSEEQTPNDNKTPTTETTETAAYKVLDGDKQTYKTNSDKNLTFRFNIEYAEFKESGKVYMDGELVDPENYSTKEGSTYVIFTKAYTKNLKAGEHTMKVTTANGEATTSFTIEATTVASANKTTSNPQTGDNIMLYVSTLLISLIGFALVNVKRKLFN